MVEPHPDLAQIEPGQIQPEAASPASSPAPAAATTGEKAPEQQSASRPKGGSSKSRA
jgi:hypothetical protein